mmetsp:Transcript_30964/g.61737  ORF Transcript_30964/g.61737 Transcript_30964/m.61737 type:complete len:731 (+) Transcript_30964:29-2221(+)
MAETTSSATNIATPSTYEADERIAARAAVSVADEKWRSLCTQHASTFVAAERRSVAVQSSLRELLEAMSRVGPSVRRVERALKTEGGGTDGEDGDDEEEGEEEEEDDEEEGDEGYFYGGEGKDSTKPKRRSAAAALADLAEKHRLRRRTLMQHSSLLELLELPSLMDACVRSSLYDDALSIAGFANTLERRHLMDNDSAKLQYQTQQMSQDVTHSAIKTNEKPQNRGDVVAGVVSEIRRREADLRRQLIHRLRGDVTMPQCLELVTALRRLNGVELERRGNTKTASGVNKTSAGGDPNDLEGVHAAMEMRLQVDFLEARDAWLESGITRVGSAAAAVSSLGEKHKLGRSGSAGGDSSGASAQGEQILDGIERYRTRCFEIVTQFLAIFRGSFAVTSSSSSNNDYSFSLLSMWTARRIQTFLTTLNSNIVTHVHDTATLRDALDAASFFASSMGRVGADFQSLLAPIFEPRLTEMVVGHWKDGLNAMMETLKTCRDAGVAAPLIGTETSSASDGADGTNPNDDVEMQSLRTPSPPRILLALPPLARFLNAYLTGLNELRRCLLPGAFPSIRAAQIKLVNDTKMVLQANERAVLTPGLRGEAAKLRGVASKMKLEFDSSVGSYMDNCLEVAFGSADYAMAAAEKVRKLEEQKAAALAAEQAEREAAERKAREEEEAKVAALETQASPEGENAEKKGDDSESMDHSQGVDKEVTIETTETTQQLGNESFDRED